MKILGLNAYHADSAAALVIDGKLVAAAEEERFRRQKHWAGFPEQSIRWCLAYAGLKPAEIDAVAVNRLPRANAVRRLLYLLGHRPDPRLVLEKIRNLGKVKGTQAELAAMFAGQGWRAEWVPVEHHEAHLASAYLASPFEDAAVVSVDGFGDFASTAWARGQGGRMKVLGKVYFPHSLGVLYTAVTQFLGFPHYGDEYKVMGLAPYGEPRFLEKMRELVRPGPGPGYALNLKYFRHDREANLYRWEGGVPELSDHFSPALEELLGPRRGKGEELTQRHKDLARSVQALYEEVYFRMLNEVAEVTGERTHLCVAGGCGQNSVANGRLYGKTPFSKVYVAASAGDAGGAVGAALAVHRRGGKSEQRSSTFTSGVYESAKERWVMKGAGPSFAQTPASGESYGGLADRFVMRGSGWGPEYTEEEIGRVVESRRADIEREGCVVERYGDEGEMCGRVARALVEGKVVGWFQGRMEWGPRALGHRSILADPRRHDVKDLLNAKIKRRESFRPFAPSVLGRAVPEWFETVDEVPSMAQVFVVKEGQRSRIPAVVHVDGTARLQTVRPDEDALYHRLIEAFEKETGVPMVLNTSFNENEPVVCRPEEALDCFLRTKMDWLQVGRTSIKRQA
jgi:carbamoyltransferase